MQHSTKSAASERLVVSFGVWNVMAKLLGSMEFLRLQGLNHFAYEIAVSRS